MWHAYINIVPTQKLDDKRFEYRHIMQVALPGHVYMYKCLENIKEASKDANSGNDEDGIVDACIIYFCLKINLFEGQ